MATRRWTAPPYIGGVGPQNGNSPPHKYDQHERNSEPQQQNTGRRALGKLLVTPRQAIAEGIRKNAPSLVAEVV